MKSLLSQLGISSIDKNIIKKVFIHKSYAHENYLSLSLEKPSQYINSYNERLEFLGDSVLSLVITHYLYQKYPEKAEGYLSKMRSELVSTPILTKVAISLQIQDFLLLGNGIKKDDSAAINSILCNTMEALIAAIYLEYGIEKVQKVIEKLWHPYFESKNLVPHTTNYKSKLQKILYKSNCFEFEYKLRCTEGPANKKIFTIDFYINNILESTGIEKSKKKAEQKAAKNYLMKNYSDRFIQKL